MTPDFPLSARLAAQFWRLEKGEGVDAVVSIDPIVLREGLRVTGPVEVGGVAIGAENLLDELLRAPYLRLTQDEQTGYFREVVRAATERLIASAGQLPRLGAMLGPLTDAGRIAVWSADADEQRILAQTSAAGMLARLDAAGEDGYGLLLDNVSGSKLDAYLDASFAAESECRPDGRAAVTLTATIRSGVPAGVDFPFTMAPGFSGVERTDLGLHVTALAPPGGVVEGVWIDGTPAQASYGTAHGHPSAGARVTVDPGADATVSFRIVAPARRGAAPVLIHTPLLVDPAVHTGEVACR
nr:DUF4012 domain-containing protein [Microbacterium sp. Marseille-Q6965]